MDVFSSDRLKESYEWAIHQIEESSLLPYIQKIILFGSVARQTNSWESDMDLFIELSEKVTELHRYNKQIILLKGGISPLNINLPEVDLKIAIGGDWETSNNLFYREIRKDGILLWERN